MMQHLTIMLAVIVPVFHVLGVLSAINAVMETRTAQGAVAWVVSLVTFPYVAVPLYWVFGRSSFHGYVQSMRAADLQSLAESIRRAGHFEPHMTPADNPNVASLRTLEHLTRMRFTGGNHARLLIDGEETFAAMLESIEGARHYVLIQFFIVKDDGIGRRVKDLLIRKQREGVRVYFLYDEIGSHALSRDYVREIVEAGAEMSAFGTTQGRGNRFQLNFRNHRKVVVVDGRVGFTGGLNVGDEYLGKSGIPKLTPWRDTMVRVEGPLVQALQIVFLMDWQWATGEMLELTWQPRASSSDWDGIVVPSGPADEMETCSLFFCACANAAMKRLWIASPYFVPDQAVANALTLASLRGVDVRVILPANADHLPVWLARHTFLHAMDTAGVQVFEQSPGFSHQKVVLIDDDAAAVGTANLDNRSLRLNFEVMAVIVSREFAGCVAEMLTRDLGRSRRVTHADYVARGFWFRAASRAARLFDPIL